jgi:hypothetical protein
MTPLASALTLLTYLLLWVSHAWGNVAETSASDDELMASLTVVLQPLAASNISDTRARML